jgi:AbiV family abortive infection protein
MDFALIQAAQACVTHARALVDSARAVQGCGHPNIAYHLAVLALEELGRRELIGVQSVAVGQSLPPPAWSEKHTQNHVQKLFWCFFGGHFFEEKLTKKSLDSLKGLAKHLHGKRLEGLYVGQDDDGLKIPSDAIKADECEEILGMAEARLTMAEAEKVRENVTDEERALQLWFLRTANDPDRRKFIFSDGSMSKLSDLKNAQEWVRWIKSEFDKVEAESIRLGQMELERSRNLDGMGKKKKWKIRIRIYSDSHTVRQKDLADWNKAIDWIKLTAVPEKKNQLIVEFILLDSIPVHGLWYFAWGLARHFVAALNIGSMGFWWWRMPEQIDSYYERIEDLETKSVVALKRSPSLKVDWGENRVLTKEDLGRVSSCFVALPSPNEHSKHGPFNYYIGGLTFLSLNDVHWQCESNIFGNFFECLRAMMVEIGDWKPGAAFEPVLVEYLGKLFPLEGEDLGRFLEIARAFEAKSPEKVTITLREASYAKLFCDTYFMGRYRTEALAKKMPSIAEKK